MKKFSKANKLSLIIVGIAVLLGVAWYVVDRYKPFSKPGSPVSQTPTESKPTDVPYKIEKVSTGLDTPWSLVFTSATRWLVSERPGVIRIIQDGQVAGELTRFAVSETGEEGLMGIELDPQYQSNKLVYACYATSFGSGIIDRVVRFEDKGTSTGNQQVLLDNIPAARFHAGCRIKFGPDGKLYITTGDAGKPNSAQDTASLAGKILRINADGSVPSDNPIAGNPVWSSGHRNPQGIAWNADGVMYQTEHGPSGSDGERGGDEVNQIDKGGNYGWPIVSHERTDKRFVNPLLVYTPPLAPSGAAFYSSDVLPQFKGQLFFTGLVGEGLFRVTFSGDILTRDIRWERMNDVRVGRVRDVVQGPDGGLYFITSNRDGRGTVRDGDDAIYRIVPQ